MPKLCATSWKAVRRRSASALGAFEYAWSMWGQGYVPKGKNVFLSVTLDKTDHDAEFQYRDHFLSPDEFEWQSQNRTTQKSTHGHLIKNHNEQGVAIHLFVRAKAKTLAGKGESFLYCGLVDFLSWSGEKPITVRLRLKSEVPAPLRQELGVPDTTAKPA